MKSVILNEFPKYQIFEDRRIRNIKTGRFLIVKGSVYLQNETGSHVCSVRKLMQQAGFNKAPEINDHQHITIKDYPNYQLYDDGRVWDSFLGRWKKFGKGEHGHLQVHLTNDQGSDDFLIHRLVYQHFVGPIPVGREWIIHHKDQHPENNLYSNLKLMTSSEHITEHKKGNQYNLGHHHTQQTKQILREKNLGKKLSEETRKKMSQRMKREWAQRKQERGG